MNDEVEKLLEDRIKQKEIEDKIRMEVEEKAKAEAEEKAQAEYMKAKAEAEVKETSLIAQDPTKALQTKLNLKVADHIDKSEVVANKIEQTAERLVDKGLKTQENKVEADEILSEDEILEADFTKNKDEYLYHGINHKIDKGWKRKLIHTINDIWFVIWAIVSCFTIVPISTFLSRIGALKGFMKGVAMVLGILLLLACLGGLTYGCLKWTGVIQ